MTDFGRLSTQYRRASQAASVLDQAVEELNASPSRKVEHHGADLGRYLASLAGLIDPAYAGEIDGDLATAVPSAVVVNLSDRTRLEPDLSKRLVQTAKTLKAGRKLKPEQVALVEQVGDVATRDAVRLSQEILSS